MKAIVFDLDDTLYPEKDYVISGFREVDQWMKNTYQLSGLFEKLVELFLKGRRGRLFNEALSNMDFDYDENLIQQLVNIYRTHTPKIELYFDAQQTLNFFVKKMPLGLITDGYAVTQRKKVAALSVDIAMNAIIFTDDGGRQNWKPNIRPYQDMVRLLCDIADEYIYIGDNPKKDFFSAKKLGWKTIRVRRPGTEHYYVETDSEYAADIQISTLFELAGILKIKDWK